MLSAIRGTGVGNNHSNAALRNVKRRRHLITDSERTLTASPDCEFAILPFRNCCAWFEGNMSDIGDSVSLLNGFGGFCTRLLYGTANELVTALDWLLDRMSF